MSDFKSLESKMNKHPDFVPIYNNDIHHFFNQCLILTDRNLELLQKAQQLEQAGTRLSNRIIDVLDNIIDESALLDALEKWEKAKEEAE
jgi:hypothetical protein